MDPLKAQSPAAPQKQKSYNHFSCETRINVSEVEVTGKSAGKRDPIHDRQLLLLGAKRNVVLELWELQRYGADNYGDEDHVSIYGMRPGEWYAKGIRLLGRTAVECTRDALGDAIGKDIAVISEKARKSKGNSLSEVRTRFDWSALHILPADQSIRCSRH